MLNELESHTYRTNFNDWYINPDCDIEISEDGLKAYIRKFNPVTWCMRSNEENKTNTNISNIYSHWKLNITNLKSIYNSSNGIDYLQFHPTGATGNTYRVHGVMVCPIMGNEEWFYRFPWDMGIPNGSWKDQNGGWSACGYIYDGIKDRSPFNSFSDGWGANSNCQMAIGIYKNISPDASKYIFTDTLPTDSSSVDMTKLYIKYTIYKTNNIYQPTIKDDGTVSWTDVGDYKEIVDISDNPIVIEILPQDNNGVNLHNTEVWKAYNNNLNVRSTFKSVKNCLSKYYGGYTSNDKLVIPYIFPTPKDTDKTIKYIIPSSYELSDLYDYTPMNLRLEIDSDKNITYVSWINKFLKNNIQDFYKIELGEQKLYTFGGMCVNNDENTPIKIYYTSTRYNESYIYYILDGLFYNGGVSTTGISRINNSQLIFTEAASGTYRISVAMRSFQNYQGTMLDIIHLDRNGNRVYPGIDCQFGFIPIQLNSTFAKCNVPIIKREWLSWNSCTNIPYAFEMMPNLTEIQSYENDEIVFWPHNVSKTNENCVWPYFYKYTTDSDGNIINKQSVNEGYSFVQAFDRCPNLTRIEPILNVKYFPNEKYVYWAFGNSPNITHVRIKGINNFNWDFTNSTNFGLINLDADSIRYIFDNAEDLVNVKYDQNNIDINNISDDGVYFDHKNIRSSISENGLIINCPTEWRDKITADMVSQMNAKGWTVQIAGENY